MEMMRYHFYNAHENKVSVARYAELFENSLKFTISSGSLTLQKASGSISGEELMSIFISHMYHKVFLPKGFKKESHGKCLSETRRYFEDWFLTNLLLNYYNRDSTDRDDSLHSSNILAWLSFGMVKSLIDVYLEEQHLNDGHRDVFCEKHRNKKIFRIFQTLLSNFPTTRDLLLDLEDSTSSSNIIDVVYQQLM
ncbi:hypothetical protein Tco_0601582 [Tanacetum coccineum]